MGPAHEIPKQEETKKPLKKYVATRSLPDLASTLGCAPGLKKGYPSEWLMRESWPIVHRALDHLEKRSKIVERIDRDDIEFAMEMTSTQKWFTSEEGIRADGLIIMPQAGDDDADAGVSGK